jgi:hypothetical protein
MSKKPKKPRPFAVAERIKDLRTSQTWWRVNMVLGELCSNTFTYEHQDSAEEKAREFNADAEAWLAEQCAACPLRVGVLEKIDAYIKSEMLDGPGYTKPKRILPPVFKRVRPTEFSPAEKRKILDDFNAQIARNELLEIGKNPDCIKRVKPKRGAKPKARRTK